ncbi:hypothetical protein ACO0QE_000237 [Hanseniaspora vineae]
MAAKIGILHCVTALLLLMVAGVSGSAEPAQSTTPTNIHELQTLQDFYSHVNNNEHRYTFIKYYTTWCSHCKMLKPIFEKVAKAYVPFSLKRSADDTSADTLSEITLFNKPLISANASSVPQVSYMEVECDLWGPYHICSRLPGYPVLELITPVDQVSQKFMLQDKQLRKNLEEEHYNSLGLWAQAWYNVKKFFTFLGGISGQDLQDMQYVMRKVEYQGKRRADKICNWLDTVILQDLERNVQSKILAGDCMGDEACEAGLQWFAGVKNDLLLEKRKLENILNNEEENSDDNTLRTLKFKLHLVEKSLELSENEPVIDEL